MVVSCLCQDAAAARDRRAARSQAARQTSIRRSGHATVWTCRSWRFRLLQKERGPGIPYHDPCICGDAAVLHLEPLGTTGSVLVLCRFGSLVTCALPTVVGWVVCAGCPNRVAVPIFRSASLFSPFSVFPLSPSSRPEPVSGRTSQITRGITPADLPARTAILRP